MRLFLSNQLAVLGGYYLADFEPAYRNKKIPRQYEFKFHINNLETRSEVLQWYLDLNSGGVVHTESELNKVRELLEQELKKQ